MKKNKEIFFMKLFSFSRYTCLSISFLISSFSFGKCSDALIGPRLLSSGTEWALLRSVLDTEDWTPALVLADYYQEVGRGVEAEAIRLAFDLQRNPPRFLSLLSKRYRRLQKIRRQLKWVVDTDEGVAVIFDRGLPRKLVYSKDAVRWWDVISRFPTVTSEEWNNNQELLRVGFLAVRGHVGSLIRLKSSLSNQELQQDFQNQIFHRILFHSGAPYWSPELTPPSIDAWNHFEQIKENTGTLENLEKASGNPAQDLAFGTAEIPTWAFLGDYHQVFSPYLELLIFENLDRIYKRDYPHDNQLPALKSNRLPPLTRGSDASGNKLLHAVYRRAIESKIFILRKHAKERLQEVAE